MLTEPQKKKYFECRKEHGTIPACQALLIAKQELPEWLRDAEFEEDRNGNKTLDFEIDGIDYHFTFEVDYDFSDIDHLGAYKSKWCAGCIKRDPDTVGRRDSAYFLPSNDARSHAETLIDMGYSKGVAWELAQSYVVRDFERAEQFGKDWVYCYASLTASYDDVKLARESIAGIESDCEEGYIKEAVQELYSEIQPNIEETIEKVRKLVQRREPSHA